MPVYRFRCNICGDFDQWFSIHASSPQPGCPDCGRDTLRVLTPPALYAVGEKGARTRDTDTREAALRGDLDAYKRLRHQGYWPPHIDGARQVEQSARSELEINSGGVIQGDEKTIQSRVAMAEEITGGRI